MHGDRQCIIRVITLTLNGRSIYKDSVTGRGTLKELKSDFIESTIVCNAVRSFSSFFASYSFKRVSYCVTNAFNESMEVIILKVR